ncbi:MULTISPECIES: serine/threonine-protein kinase [unclassified Coleofasciculus]|uniref:serine/threonine-protein kinase n=1 Tax=unclassified Coleofasciculus TaxID=2692782 RepID=UPI001880E5A4|nr:MULTISPECIES: serine/threonine-protein kinase [unclassified Coleofasciculus]MBE9125494.1 pentapeptide repeat-containing protein [Coleofasciculus sp. LEGE 07081]MBE9148642.1 pentapeptide repeat-containing protein [Coleofasciculus sp. LEGE 07092]
MSYCLNPDCPQPKNPPHVDLCQACGFPLLLRDRYRVFRTLGQGGFGATFLAQDESLPGNPSCVIKQLRPATTAPQVLEMAEKLFEREARTLGKIGNHPQVPRLLDYFEDHCHFYLVQEYICGSNLQQEIKQCGPLPEAGVKQFLSEVLPLIQYIHSQEVIHRDIKPANLIRREQDRKLVLIDFGAVKDEVNQAAVTSTSDQTALTNFAIGTPGFAPPEQMALRPVYASDIYALGVTCIYLLTGKSPKDLDYNPSTGEMVWRKCVHVSDHFAEVLKKMLEASVRHRYQSSEEILRALDLEPYLDQLAKGMATPTSANPSSNGSNLYSPDLEVPSSPSSPSSATEKLAAAIRRRRERRERTTPGSYNSGSSRSRSLTPQGPSTGLMNSQSFTTSKPKKLDANGLLKAYLKGRRDFASQDLSGLELTKANLSGGIFYQAKLARTNFQGADLSNADFGQASLNRTNLRDTNLGRAYLSNADLEGADLRGADLSFAYLNNANLKGANLCGANLSNAKITEEQLSHAKTNWATVLPSGKRGFW